MNIICNNCVGARLYEVSKLQFPNPFMWMTISLSDFILLANDFEKLDLKHPKFELEQYKKNNYETVLTTTPEGIKLHYIHYIQDDQKEEPTKECNTNVRYKDILDYAKDKWFTRLERMNEEPTILYSFNYISKDDPSYGKKLDGIRQITKHRCLVLVHDGVDLGGSFPKNVKIIPCKTDIMNLAGTKLAVALKDSIFNSDHFTKQGL